MWNHLSVSDCLVAVRQSSDDSHISGWNSYIRVPGIPGRQLFAVLAVLEPCFAVLGTGSWYRIIPVDVRHCLFAVLEPWKRAWQEIPPWCGSDGFHVGFQESMRSPVHVEAGLA